MSAPPTFPPPDGEAPIPVPPPIPVPSGGITYVPVVPYDPCLMPSGTTQWGIQPCEMPTELPATGAASFFISFTASFIVSLGIVLIRRSRRSPR